MGVRWLPVSSVDDAPGTSTDITGVTDVVDGQERSNKGVVVMAVPTTPNAGFGEVG